MVISYGMENRSSLGQAKAQGKIEADILIKPDLLVGCGPPVVMYVVFTPCYCLP